MLLGLGQSLEQVHTQSLLKLDRCLLKCLSNMRIKGKRLYLTFFWWCILKIAYVSKVSSSYNQGLKNGLGTCKPQWETPVLQYALQQEGLPGSGAAPLPCCLLALATGFSLCARVAFALLLLLCSYLFISRHNLAWYLYFTAVKVILSLWSRKEWL